MRQTLTFFICIILFVSCSPERQLREYPLPRQNFAPIGTDTRLVFMELPSNPGQAENKFPFKFERQAIATEDFFDLSRTLIELGRLRQEVQLQKLGHQLIRQFYNLPKVTFRSNLIGGPYHAAMYSEATSMIVSESQSIEQLIDEQRKFISSVIKETLPDLESKSQSVNLQNIDGLMRDYLSELIQTLEISKVDPLLLNPIKETTEKEVLPQIADLKLQLDTIRSQSKLSAGIKELEKLLEKYQIRLDEKSRQQLNQAERMARKLDTTDRAQEALTVLVDIWIMMSQEDRLAYIKPVSPELYQYFNEADQSDLECLKSSGCDFLAKLFAIFPGLHRYGIERLVSEINRAGQTYLVRLVEDALPRLVRSLPGKIDAEIHAKVDAQIEVLNSYQKRPENLLNQILQRWAQKDMGDEGREMRSFETSEVTMELDRSELLVKPLRKSSNALDGGAIGSALLASSVRFSEMARFEGVHPKTPEFYRNVIETFQKVLSLSGYQSIDSPAQPAWSSPNNSEVRFSLRDFSTSESLFLFPNHLERTSGFAFETKKVAPDFHIRSQIRLLDGFSGLAHYFRDWEKNSFDRGLGQFNVGDYLSEDQKGSFFYPLFPKQLFFTVTIANALSLVANFEREMSPLALLGPDGKLKFWSDEAEGQDPTLAMVAPVDIIKGSRQTQAKTSDTVNLILALVRLDQVLAEIHLTQSTQLKTPQREGAAAPIERIQKSQQSIRALIMALSNFLSSRLVSKDGEVAETYSIAEGQTIEKAQSLRTYAMAILGLTAASQHLGVEVYSWTAQEIYFAMNRKLWEPKINFYSLAQKESGLRPNLKDIIFIIYAIENLRPTLNSESQAQAKRIVDVWSHQIATGL